MNGCRNPNAVNYSASADTEDFSCLYLEKHDGVCHAFTDVVGQGIIDQSYTISFSVEGGSWVFYHDYVPDFYFHTRKQLYSLKDNIISKHNDNRPGMYYGTPKPFFIDLVFKAPGDVLLESVRWVTEYLSGTTDSKFATFSHLSVWNSTQHSGRIPVTQIMEMIRYKNSRRTKGEWSFNEFRDVLIENAGTFLQDIFSNFALEPGKVNAYPAWYNQGELQDSWFCIRFEFDNMVDAKVVLHETAVEALKSDR